MGGTAEGADAMTVGRIDSAVSVPTDGAAGSAGQDAGPADGPTGSDGGGDAGAGTLRIMPLGDSTTAFTCVRSALWQMLAQAGRTKVDFIGSRSGDAKCAFTGYDQDHEGHGGYLVSDVLKPTSTGRAAGADPGDPYVSAAPDLATWFDGRPADVVLMHFGTNDIWSNISPAKILDAYAAVLARLRQNNPKVRLLVAQIIPLAPASCPQCPARVQTLNAMIPAWATTQSTPASPVQVIDQATGFDLMTDTNDKVHPNAAGAQKMAAKWFAALSPLL
jgi:lysophospholipase L1-like esterase